MTTREIWMKTNFTMPAVLAIALAFCVTPSLAATAVAKVNGKEIPQSRADMVVKANTAQGQADTPDLRNRVRLQLVECWMRSEAIVQHLGSIQRAVVHERDRSAQ